VVLSSGESSFTFEKSNYFFSSLLLPFHSFPFCHPSGVSVDSHGQEDVRRPQVGLEAGFLQTERLWVQQPTTWYDEMKKEKRKEKMNKKSAV